MKRTLTRSEGLSYRGKTSVKTTIPDEILYKFLCLLKSSGLSRLDFVNKHLKNGEYNNFSKFLKIKETSPLKLPIFEGAIIKFLEEK